MTGNEIREKFLRFFEDKKHKRLPSASLIPENDPSILWTAAGMVPFKPYFTGMATPKYKRITTCQKCLRTPDIEEVGKTARHHTFFEMLGNFSFGDYFKEEAITWAWEFVTGHLKLPEDKLWVSIYLDDDEAFAIWNKKVGMPADRIIRLGKEDNFWEIGVGPCGPCSEIHVDLGKERGCGAADCSPACDCDRFLEIWNLVFIQFFKDENGEYSPLENKGIDTGMGLERVASVIQGVPTNFDTDLLREIMDFTAGLLGVKYGQEAEVDRALKVIADHTRAITFAISDGALPSNEGRGYVVRRLLRRAVRFGRLLGKDESFLFYVAEAVVKQMQQAYPELVGTKDHVLKVIQNEEEKFGATLAQGTDILGKLVKEARKSGKRVIEGREAFKLYDTFGFPLELTKEMAGEEGIEIDEEGFNKALEEQRERARQARQETEYLSEKDAWFKDIRDKMGRTKFLGYQQLSVQGKILCLIANNETVDLAGPGADVYVILDATPCYAEAGGQVADRGKIITASAEAEIIDVFRPVEGLHVHRCRVKSGTLKVRDTVKVEVDATRRRNVARNHSATHLLHKVLKEVLGEHVDQAGSLVEPDRLRFDFTHYAALSKEQLQEVEWLVNQHIMNNLPIEAFETSFEEAQAMGAVALFGEKYGDKVRVVNIGDYSLELCGGTHLSSTAQVGLFKLVSEGSVGAGIRRVEAVTGAGALKYVESLEDELDRIAAMLKVTRGEIKPRIEMLLKLNKEQEEEIETLRAKLAKYEVEHLLSKVIKIEDFGVLAAQAGARDIDSLRAMVDLLRDTMGSGVIVLGTRSGDKKVNLVAAVSKDLVSRGLHAGKIIKEVASVMGGGGGGRPEMAQAGGKDPSRLQEALDKVVSIVKREVK